MSEEKDKSVYYSLQYMPKHIFVGTAMREDEEGLAFGDINHDIPLSKFFGLEAEDKDTSIIDTLVYNGMGVFGVERHPEEKVDAEINIEEHFAKLKKAFVNDDGSPKNLPREEALRTSVTEINKLREEYQAKSPQRGNVVSVDIDSYHRQITAGLVANRGAELVLMDADESKMIADKNSARRRMALTTAGNGILADLGLEVNNNLVDRADLIESAKEEIAEDEGLKKRVKCDPESGEILLKAANGRKHGYLYGAGHLWGEKDLDEKTKSTTIGLAYNVQSSNAATLSLTIGPGGSVRVLQTSAASIFDGSSPIDQIDVFAELDHKIAHSERVIKYLEGRTEEAVLKSDVLAAVPKIAFTKEALDPFDAIIDVNTGKIWMTRHLLKEWQKKGVPFEVNDREMTASYTGEGSTIHRKEAKLEQQANPFAGISILPPTAHENNAEPKRKADDKGQEIDKDSTTFPGIFAPILESLEDIIKGIKSEDSPSVPPSEAGKSTAPSGKSTAPSGVK